MATRKNAKRNSKGQYIKEQPIKSWIRKEIVIGEIWIVVLLVLTIMLIVEYTR
tara:strand:+ start:4876 stop:5034 length:159 start_codon:yes stop_codon:yes gene_type:complete